MVNKCCDPVERFTGLMLSARDQHLKEAEALTALAGEITEGSDWRERADWHMPNL